MVTKLKSFNQFRKTSFKIGTMIGIIILFLGIAIITGIFQMYKVSQEIIEISEQYTPIQSHLSKIKANQLQQTTNLDKIMSLNSIDDTQLDAAKENFWISSGIIDSEIHKIKKLTKAGKEISSTTQTQSNFELIDTKINNIETLIDEYQEFGRKIFSNSEINDLQINPNIKQRETQIQQELDLLNEQISSYIEQSINSIEENERVSLTNQVVVILIIGGLAGILGFFLNQINRDLEKEVELKTRQLKEANKKLQEIDKKKDEFIGIASHELKSPIQPIFGFAELAKSGDIDQNEAWEGVTEIARKLQDLANDVLDVSRIESNRLLLNKEKIKINDLILNITKSFKIDPNQRIPIYENLDENIEIFVDKLRMSQVFRNLISNALKFTENGQVKISTNINWDKNRLQVRISDTGSGIPNEILPKIFDKFVTKNYGLQNQQGTGLGLFLCKGIIEEHGGKIIAYNNKDKGATFEFWIPLQAKIINTKIKKGI